MHFWSCDITKHEIYKIGHISAIFEDRDFWFGPNNSINLCAEHFTILSHKILKILLFEWQSKFAFQCELVKIRILILTGSVLNSTSSVLNSTSSD